MIHSWPSRLGIVASLLIVALAASNADASPLFEQTGSMVGTGGLNARFTGHDSSSAYFNPASIVKAKNGIDLGIAFMRQDIGITLGSRSGEVGGQSNFDIAGSPTLQFPNEGPIFGGFFGTQDLYLGQSCAPGKHCLSPRPRQGDGTGHQTFSYITIGLTQHVFQDYLVASFYAMLPLGNFTSTNAFFVDEREQYFSNSLHPEMYGDRMRAPSIAVAVASSPIPELSIGLGMTIALLNTANAGVFTRDASDLDGKAILGARVGVIAKIAPHFAVNYRPLPDLQLSAVAHSPSRFDIGLNFSNTLDTGDEQTAQRSMVHDYTPWLIAFGAQYRFHIARFYLDLVAGIRVGLWSNYVNRHNKVPGHEYTPQGYAVLHGGYGWKNTVDPSIGVRFGEEDHWGVGVDFKYVPTPVPDQTGRTNYVDNNKFVSALHANYRFDAGPIEMGVGAALQGHFLFKRRNTKIMPKTTGVIRNPDSKNFGNHFRPDLVIDEIPDTLHKRGEDAAWDGAQGLQTNNPGFPWFESGGMLFGGTVYVSFYY